MTSALILASPDKYIGVHRERSSRGGASDGRPSSAYGKFVTLGVTRGLPAVAPPVSLMTLPISPLLPRRTVIMLTATPIIQQQVAGLASGGQYTFYVWGKVASGTKQVSIAIVDIAYAGDLAGPTSITLSTVWQRFKITGTLAGGQTGLWIVVRQFAGNGDNWTSGAIYLWGACLQQG